MTNISDAGRSTGDIMYRLAELERQVQSLQTARRMESASIGRGGIRLKDGGGILVDGGGDVVIAEGEILILRPDGRVSTRLSRSPAGGGQISTYHPNGAVHAVMGELWIEATGDVVGQGLVVQQDDGTDVIGAAPRAAGEPTVLRIRDHRGNLMIATDDGDDGLMHRPYRDVPMYSSQSDGAWRWTGTSENVIARGRLWVTHPAVRVQVRAWVSTGSATIRCRVGGTLLGQQVISNTSAQSVDFGWQLLPQQFRDLPYSFGEIVITGQGSAADVEMRVIPYGVTLGGSDNVP